jgi:hypothetical protein
MDVKVEREQEMFIWVLYETRYNFEGGILPSRVAHSREFATKSVFF